jgi:glutamate racemase
VLGCTHYPFVRPLFEQVLGPEVRIIDTSDAVARHVAHLVTELPPCASDSPSKPSDAVSDGHIRFWSSGNPALLGQIVQRWFSLACAAQPLP